MRSTSRDRPVDSSDVVRMRSRPSHMTRFLAVVGCQGGAFIRHIVSFLEFKVLNYVGVSSYRRGDAKSRTVYMSINI